MINLGTSNFISNLLDSSDSEKGSENIKGILAAIVGHTGSKLSAKDVVNQLVGSMGTAADETAVSEDAALLNNIETQVQGYVDNCGSCDANENLQALNDLYTQINSLVKESLKAEQNISGANSETLAELESLGDDASRENAEPADIGATSSALLSESNLPGVNDFAPTQSIEAVAFQAAERNSRVTESVEPSSSNVAFLSSGNVESNSTAHANRSQQTSHSGLGRGSDLALDMHPGAAYEIPNGVSMQQIQTEVTRLKQAIEKAIL